DRTLLADQRSGTQVANHSVISNWRITKVVVAQTGSRNTARPIPKPIRPSTPTTTKGNPTWIATSVTLKRIPIRVTHPLHPSPRFISVRTRLLHGRLGSP